MPAVRLDEAAQMMLGLIVPAKPNDHVDDQGVLGYNYKVERFVPGFQFDTNGSLNPAAKEVNAILGEKLGNSTAACLWWHLPNPWLDYAVPVSLLGTDRAGELAVAAGMWGL